MKIEQVNISNFKSLKDVTIKLSNLTLLTGVNSSGKSSFIQTLLLLKQNAENIKMFIIFNSILNDTKDKGVTTQFDEMKKNIPPFSLDGEYITLGEGKSLLYQDVFNELINIKLTYSDEQTLTISFNTDSNCTAEQDSPTKKDPNLAFNMLSNFHYIRTDRAIPSITYPLSVKHIRNNSIGFNGEYATHYLAENRHKILNIKQFKHPNTATEQLLENVSAWLGEISSGINISATIHEQLQMASLTYQYEYDEQTTAQYTPLNVGFGITYVLPIIVAILKSEPGDLLIIENPESHLHPAGQSKIAELCSIAASNGVQIIIETHSDHFLNGVRVAIKKELLQPDDSQIYFFQKSENNLETITTALNIDKDGRIDEWPKGFFDEWDNKLNELLW
jgi:predicted ATPase